MAYDDLRKGRFSEKNRIYFVTTAINNLEEVIFKAIIFPDLKTAQLFEFFVSKNFRNQNKILKEARDILLPRLMTGMIDVEHLNHFVGADLSALCD